MSWGGKRKWPKEAEVRLTVRCTYEQRARWQQEASTCGRQDVETWLVTAGDFFAWWWKRDRELRQEHEERLHRESRERLGLEPCEQGSPE